MEGGRLTNQKKKQVRYLDKRCWKSVNGYNGECCLWNTLITHVKRWTSNGLILKWMDEQINRSYLLLIIYFDLCIKEAEELCIRFHTI